MRIRIKKEMLSTVFLLLTILFTARVFADAEGCPSFGSCEPCGYTTGNAANAPSYGPGVNPLLNYTASAERVRCFGYFSGPYVGAAYGLGNINYHLKINGLTPFGMDNDARSYLVTIFNGGFNLVLDYFFLGAEVGYNYRSRINPISYFDDSDSLSTEGDTIIAFANSFPCKVRMDINSQHAVTADLLPGFVISRFVGYLRLGVEQTNYTWDRRVCFPFVAVNNVDELAVDVFDQDFVQTRKRNATGYRLGAGFGVAAGPHVSFHLNYIHTFGKKITFTPDVSAIAANLPVLIISDTTTSTITLNELAADNVIEPQRDEVNFGVKFRF